MVIIHSFLSILHVGVKSGPKRAQGVAIVSPSSAVQDRPTATWRSFYLALGLLFTTGLVAILAPSYLAMQDYPQHLFMAQVLHDLGRGELGWTDHYVAQFRLGPYALFYLVTDVLAEILPIDLAGRLFVTSALGLLVLYVVFFARSRCVQPPWAALLAVPLFFSQVFYFGFTNYVFSLPLLLFALHFQQDLLLQKLNGWRILAFAAVLLLLCLTHPYSLLVFITLALLLTAMHRASWRTGVLPPLILLTLFVVWYLTVFTAGPDRLQEPAMVWTSPRLVAYFLIMPLLNMQSFYDFSFSPFQLLWLACLGLIGWQAAVSGDARRSYLVMAFALLMGVFALPFLMIGYAHFNLRLAAVFYLVRVFAVAGIRLHRTSALVYCGLLGGIMLTIIVRHFIIAAETERLQSLFAHMEPNATIGALYTDGSSSALDKAYFYQFHDHGHFYYHLEVGGGRSTPLFKSRFNPVFRKPLEDPSPDFLFGRLGPSMEPGSVDNYIGVARNGPWLLYRHNPGGASN